MASLATATRQSFRLPPVTLLAAALALGLGVCAAVAFLAHKQPWLGLKLVAAGEGPGAVVRVSEGPSAGIPEGLVLSSVAGGGDRMRLLRLDLTTEPDGAMGDFATYRRFLERQDRLARIQAAGEVTFTSAEGRRFVVRPGLEGRPPGDLPPDFWVQCSVGLIAWLVSAAVFAFRPGESSARYLLLSGASTLLFAPAAAVYTTRELAVPGSLLRWASDLNFFGGSLFAASFVALLLVYPRRIGPTWVGPGVVALFVGWFAAQQVGVFESMTFARRFLVMAGVFVTFALAGWHWHTSGRDPLARAKLQWFLLSWVVGTGAFALFILLPQTLGIDTSPVQGYAFLLFVLVYLGLAMGILRYRLFELGDWWRRVVAWAITVLLLVVLDSFFLFGLHLSTGNSLAAALLICGLFWIPLRGFLWGRFADSADGRKTADLFRRVMNVALATDEAKRVREWRRLMESVFAPLEIGEAALPGRTEVAIRDDGLSMELPGVGPLGGLRLRFAHGGRRLFRPRDAALAGEIVYMLEHGLESLAAYNRGKAEERGRIARDIHDNIGAQLLSALHHPHAGAKDEKIRESIADLRKVINETPEKAASIAETLADLRVETAERLESAGMRLAWQTAGPDETRLHPAVGNTVRSIFREATSNAIRHSGADELAVKVGWDTGGMRIELRDDGRGFDSAKSVSGNGLANIRLRVESLGGSLNLSRGAVGTVLEARIPVPMEPVRRPEKHKPKDRSMKPRMHANGRE